MIISGIQTLTILEGKFFWQGDKPPQVRGLLSLADLLRIVGINSTGTRWGREKHSRLLSFPGNARYPTRHKTGNVRVLAPGVAVMGP